jgi:GMP synthase (glutamine-hydrolysing)
MIVVVDLGYEYIDRLLELIDEFIEVKTVKIHDLSEEHTANAKGVIISSAQLTVQMETAQNYLGKLEVLLKADKPVLGCGVGHHFLGLLYAAQLAYQPFRNEIEEISLLYDVPIFDKLPEDIEVAFKHSGGVAIPRNFELIATSDRSINEGMKHKEKEVYGLQFLPEMSGNHGRIIIQNFVEIAEKHG